MTALQIFWTWILGISVVLFCTVELLIVVGGAYDIRAMLRSLRERSDAPPGDTEKTAPPCARCR